MTRSFSKKLVMLASLSCVLLNLSGCSWYTAQQQRQTDCAQSRVLITDLSKTNAVNTASQLPNGRPCS